MVIKENKKKKRQRVKEENIEPVKAVNLQDELDQQARVQEMPARVSSSKSIDTA